MIYMHRVVSGVPSGVLTDHRDQDTLNNRRDNLRAANHCQNGYNRRKHVDNTSGYKGVGRWGDRWRAFIAADRRDIHIGLFNSPLEAARAYNDAASRLHGEFALLNHLPC
jgi:hypothetical protein